MVSWLLNAHEFVCVDRTREDGGKRKGDKRKRGSKDIKVCDGGDLTFYLDHTASYVCMDSQPPLLLLYLC